MKILEGMQVKSDKEAAAINVAVAALKVIDSWKNKTNKNKSVYK